MTRCIITCTMERFLRCFKCMRNYTNKSNRNHDEFMRQFYVALNNNRKTVLDTNIVGLKLSAARELLPDIIICPYEMDDVVIGNEEVYMTHRVNVAIHGDVITRIIHFG